MKYDRNNTEKKPLIEVFKRNNPVKSINKKLFQLHGLFMVPVRIYPHTELRNIALQDNLIKASDDLLKPKFFQSRNRLVNLADRAVVVTLSLLWKLRHLKSRI